MNKVLKGLVAVAATAAMAVAGFAGAASATAEETTATKYQITVPRLILTPMMHTRSSRAI